jgi:hypothetical protein
MTVTPTTAGVYMLDSEHADAILRFAADTSLATMVGIEGEPTATAGEELIARTTAARLAGESYWNAVVDRGETKGLSALIGPYTAEPRLVVWIDPACRRCGYGELALRLGLEFAFRNIQLAHVHVTADVADPAQQALLRKFGFAPSQHAGEYDLTRDDWKAHRDRPALAKLHPALRAILEAELAAGNEVAETGGGWPDPDSVFVRLRHPFRTTPSPVPAGVVYTEPNDPHWWKADYSSVSPRHILAC